MSEKPSTGPDEENSSAAEAQGVEAEGTQPTPSTEQDAAEAQQAEVNDLPPLPPIVAPTDTPEPAIQAPEESPAQTPPAVEPLEAPALDATRLDLEPATAPATAAAPVAAAPTAAAQQPTQPVEPQEPAVPTKRKRRGGKIAALSIGGVVVLAGAVYAGAAFLTQDKLPAHLSVDGVDVSGQKPDEAKATLEQQLLPRASKALKLTAGDQSVALKPSAAGLGLDIDSTLDSLTGLSWDPSVIAARIFGSQDVQVKTTLDQAKLSKSMQDAAKALSSDPVEGSIVVAQGKADYTEPQDGVTVDPEATGAAFKAQWLHSNGTIAAAASTAAPKVPAEALKSFLDTKLTPLLDGPITVDNGKEKAQLTALQIGNATQVKTDGAAPTLSIDGEKLLADVVEANPKMSSDGHNATVKLNGSGSGATISVVPAQEGKGIDAKALSAAVEKASAESARTAAVELQITQPTISTKVAEGWKMEKVAEFATPYPTYDTVRTKNLRLGASRVNGAVVEPGEEFNLGDRFGPITTANGYVASGVVENGNATTALGGGISQISTMSYNAGFLGGMDILEHKPHSRWFDRYPAGRESTFWEGQVNMRWKNNTKAPVVVQMWVTDDQVKTVLWGVKTWNVKTKTSDHYNVTSPTTVHSTAAKCTPEGGGKSGFTVTVTRDRSSATQTLPQETFKWTYSPWNRVVCDKK